MPTAALAIASLAFIIALSAKTRADKNARELESIRDDLRRRSENTLDEVDAKIDRFKELMTMIAAGNPPSPEMIREGRLWNEVDGATAARMAEEAPLRLIDVRSPQETAGGVLPGAILIPIDELEQRQAEIPKDGKPALIYCAMGGRSAAACEMLSQLGHRGLTNLVGGIGAWPGPTVKPD